MVTGRTSDEWMSLRVSRWYSSVYLNLKDPDVLLLDFVAHFLDGGGVVFHHLDLLERDSSFVLLGVRMHGSKSADINNQLMTFRREAVVAEQLCRVRIRRCLEHAGRSEDEW